MAKIAETPLMKQYTEMKAKHPDALLLFRVGDFYETFSQDAIDASSILGITLTRRANGAASSVELAGFPHHALDTYLPRLVRAGRRVAICEQLEDPKLAKKLVKRGITELITPGVNMSDTLLKGDENNFLAGVHFGGAATGVAFLDISTGEFLCAQGDNAYIDKLLTNIAPKEVLRMCGTRRTYEELFSHRSAVFELDDWVYTREAATDRLLRHFGTATLKGFGIDEMPDAVVAAASLLYYLDQTNHTNLGHITSLSRIEEDKYVRLDRFTIRNLELLTPNTPEGKSLIDVIDKTVSPMGARMLKRWILFPLLDIGAIRARQDVVEYFFRDTELREQLVDRLRQVGDLERLVSKVSVHRVSPRDMAQIKEGLRVSAHIRRLFAESSSKALKEMARKMPDLTEVADLIDRTLVPNPPAMLSKGDVIAPGVNAELDELRALHSGSRQALDDMQARESAATGIPSLKIAFNNVFGYYIEVRNTHKERVPQEWIRKQTLVSAERYITPELKEYEQKIMGAEDKIQQIETTLFATLTERVAAHSGEIQACAAILARVDCLLSFALASLANKYNRPEVNDSLAIAIREGRHPVIEKQLPPGEPYVSNSVELDSDGRQVIMITGPNMSGKSAFLRQTALIVLLAQTGCFVPAESASIGLVDKIFTRVGASDNLSMGESTFMVEMTESASILNNMSKRSLILFDELGRGTSTYDGISIAWAIVEHIHENGYCRPKTLFATHYHELAEMEKSFKRIANFNVSVDEVGGKVTFLRKLRPGASEHSFGIHVARLAGMPPSITKRADQILKQLEDQGGNAGEGKPNVDKSSVGNIGQTRDGLQLSFFQLDDPLLEQIRDKIIDLDIDNLTPLQSLTKLHELRALVTGK